MAFASSAMSALPIKFSIGPVKVEIQAISAASGDTSGTVTAQRLSRVDVAIVCAGLQQSAAPSISGNAVTLAFADPLATVHGHIILLGR